MDRVPPCSIESEQALLGSLMVAPELIDDVKLKVNDLYMIGHQKIYQAILELLNSGASCDCLNVFEQLKKNGVAEQAGGIEYLTTIMNYAIPRLDYICKVLKEKSLLRKVIKLAQSVEIVGYNESLGQEEIFNNVDSLWQKILKDDEISEYKTSD